MITIALASQKGGTAKTSSAVSLSAAYTMSGYRVLLVDLDAQSSATLWLTDAYATEGRATWDVLMRETKADDVILRTRAGFDLMPSDLRLSSLDIDLLPKLNKDQRLAGALEEVSERYDLCLVDCPPSLGAASVNAFAAAQVCVIPIDCRAQALDAVPYLLKSLAAVAKEFRTVLRVFALPTFYQRTNLAREIYEQIQTRFESATLPPIHQNTRIAEAYLARETIFAYDATALGAVDYLRAAKELEDEIRPKQDAVRHGSRRIP